MANRIKLFKRFLFILFCCAISCKKSYEVPIQEKAWVPVYLSVEVSTEVTALTPRAPIKGGKIYAYGEYLFQLEPNLGIHMYELRDKRPIPLRFIQVYGAQEMAIRNDILYTNNSSDIISLEINGSRDVREVGRVKNVFQASDVVLPPESGYFECVQPEKGVVIDWELKENVRAQCKI